jgi:heptosyltransferase II
MTVLRPENIKRIVVRGTNWLGDAVMTVPALRELRRLLPEAHITLATRSWAKDLFADADFIDDILIYDRDGLSSVARQIGEWRRRDFDLALLFQNSFEAALIAFLSRVTTRIGYATDGRRALLTNPLPLPEWRGSKHEVFYYLNVVAEFERLLTGSQTILQKEPECALYVSAARQMQGHSLLRANGIVANSLLVALCPGSINSRAKRWPSERYAQLADRLIEELGARVLLIGSAAELAISLQVSSSMRQKPVILTGKTELSQLIAILSVVDLLVTNDTGPAHIAPALGIPTLVVFGPTNPLTTRPFSPRAELVRHPPDCAPCMLRDCPIDHRCMTAISSDEVFERARILLEQRIPA